jgi:hypothetical protein
MLVMYIEEYVTNIDAVHAWCRMPACAAEKGTPDQPGFFVFRPASSPPSNWKRSLRPENLTGHSARPSAAAAP